MERYWKAEEERAMKAKTNPSLKRVLLKVFGLEFMMYGIVLAISEAIRIAQPLALGQLIAFYVPGQNQITPEEAYWYAAVLYYVP
ncbi:hypothetical protein NQ317_001954 [Molorchus minor]|uniref:ABC transporter ATP-binding protein n=1 Tax=Molorchus minor TaxID=1323400 RepID=A0ABQ9J9M8_9CUCU|nr:hypothetical protein NQ317_001954 [Molorchus minor]